MTPSKCPRCSRALPDAAGYCPRCGLAVRPVPVPPRGTHLAYAGPAARPPSAPPPVPTPPAPRAAGFWLIFALAIMAVMGLGALWFIATPSHVVANAPIATQAVPPTVATSPPFWRQDRAVFLAGSSWPGFLEPSDVLQAGDGLHPRDRQVVRTRDADFLSTDFSFEALVAVRDQGSGVAFVGIGDGGRNSVTLRLYPPADARPGRGMAAAPPPDNDLAERFPWAGTHRVRVEKAGDQLTFSIEVNGNAASSQNISRVIPRLRAYAPALADDNAHLFFGGGATFKEIRIVRHAE